MAAAQAPLPPSLPDARLAWVFPAGGRVGTTFDVTVRGDDLDDSRQLLFDDPGISSIVKLAEPGLGQTGPQPVPGVFTVAIKPEVKPGVYEVRVLGKYGISTPRAFIVGTQPEITESEPNDALNKANLVPLGTVVNGCGDGTTRDYFKFPAKKGQRIIIDCQAFRIDSRLDGTLVLYNSAGIELDRDRNTNRRDPMIDFTVPEDGDYIVALYDHVYGYYTVQGECFYRLSISTAPHLDFIFPPAGLPGSQGQYTVYGRNLPGGQPATGVSIGGKQLEKLAVTIGLPADKARDPARGMLIEPSESFIDGMAYRLDTPQGLSNPLVVGMAGAPVVVEEEPNDDPAKAPLLKLPCEYVGQFYPRGDRDWVSFEAKKGDVYWIEVFSQRLGLSTDPYLLVQQVKKDDKGAEQVIDLQEVDDVVGNSADVHWSFLAGLLFSTATHDPAYRFVAPEDGTYRVMVRDMTRTSHDDPRAVYRLSIRSPQPDFRLVAVPRPPTNTPLQGSQRTVWSPLLRKGGAELIEVYAWRRDGFDKEIVVSAEGLPAGVSAAPVVITPGQISATLVLRAADDAPPGVGMVTISGKAMIGQTDAVRLARNATMIWADQLTGVTYSRSRLTSQLPVAVSAVETAPISISVAPDLMLEASRLGTVKFPVSVVRRGDFKGSLLLSVHGWPLVPGTPTHAQYKFAVDTEVKADATTAEFTITVPNFVPTGTYSFFLSGTGTVSYARTSETLKAAQVRKLAVEKLVAENDARAKAALEAQATAEKKRLESDATRLKAAEDLKVAEKAVADAQTVVNSATAKAAEAAAALAKDPANANLVAAKQSADKAADEAKLKLKTATEAKLVAEKGATAAADQLKAVTEAKAAADKAVADTAAKAKESAAFLQTFTLEVAKLEAESKPADVMIASPSNRFTLKITPAPVTLELAAASVEIKQGTKREIPFSIKRLYGSADVVYVAASTVPYGLSGVGLSPVTLPAAQTQGMLVLDVSNAAPTGKYALRVQASVVNSGQNLSFIQQIPLTIEKADAPK